MAQDKTVNNIMASAAAIDADDPDMIAKLNEIALKIAEAQGKRQKKSTNPSVESDPMDELGCEGCQ